MDCIMVEVIYDVDRVSFSLAHEVVFPDVFFGSRVEIGLESQKSECG